MSALQISSHNPVRANQVSERFTIVALHGTEYIDGYAVSEIDGTHPCGIQIERDARLIRG
jgi:hypothetical protein